MAVAHIIFEVFGKKTRLGINPVSQAIEDHENRLSYRTRIKNYQTAVLIKSTVYAIADTCVLIQSNSMHFT